MKLFAKECEHIVWQLKKNQSEALQGKEVGGWKLN